MSFTGLGPHGEHAVPADKIVLSEAEGEMARAGRFTVALVLHTTTSDWSRQTIAGMVSTLGTYSAAVVEIIDCAFGGAEQKRGLDRLARERIDAVISVPVGGGATTDSHRAVARSGKKLILLDNTPTGLHWGDDYSAFVSTDNFWLGVTGAELLSPHLPEEAVAGVLTYGSYFFATNEREIAFRKWMGRYRPDVTVVRDVFQKVDEAGAACQRLLDDNSDLNGLFVAWDVPAIDALATLRAGGRRMATTTVDLGNAIALELTDGGLVTGIAAQRPYEQGVACAAAALRALLGHQLPPWIALPGLAVTQRNVVEAYQVVWHSPAPASLLRARRLAKD